MSGGREGRKRRDGIAGYTRAIDWRVTISGTALISRVSRLDKTAGLSCHGGRGARPELEESTRHARLSIAAAFSLRKRRQGNERALRRDPPSRSPVFVNARIPCAYRERPERDTHAPPFTTGARERGASYQRQRHVAVGAGVRDVFSLPPSWLSRVGGKKRWRVLGILRRKECASVAGAKWVSRIPRVYKMLIIL